MRTPDRKTGWLLRQAVKRLAQPRQATLTAPTTNPSATPMEVVVRTPAWLVYYDGTVLPHNDPAPWTKTENGAVAYAVAGGVLTVTDNSDLEYANWYIAAAALNAAQGGRIEALVKVTAGSAVADAGAHLAVWDGAQGFVLWLRATGVNVDGEADYPLDLTAWTRVALVTRGSVCYGLVNDVVVQSGGAVGASANKRFGFGSGFAGAGQSTAEWDWVGGALNWS